MASANLVFRLTGGASNSDPDASLGGVMSSEEVSATAMNNLFDNVEPSEASAGDTEYRAIDIYNDGDAAAEAIDLWIDTQTASPDTSIEVALDATTQSIGDEGSAPSGVSFSAPTSGSPLSVGDIAALSSQRLWIKRIVSASADNHANDLCGLTVRYA